MDLPQLMRTTPGFTKQRFTAEPLGSEGELTPGPDDANPFADAEDREVVEAYERKEREQAERGMYRESVISLPFAQTTKDDPSKDPDPYVFDDVNDEVGMLQLPALAGDDADGPQF